MTMLESRVNAVEARRVLGVTQEAFAGILGVSFVTVNRWENGHAVPLRPVQDLLDALLAASCRVSREKLRSVCTLDRPSFLRELYALAYPRRRR